jgi:DNA-binding GntR family transcriptional regulator
MNAADRVYNAVRSGILAGEYELGSRLGEVELATAFGVSRTPVREALRRLGSEGLLETLPNRGARVRSWSTKELDDIFDVRSLLEGHAAAHAAGRTELTDLTHLSALCDGMDAASGGPEVDYDKLAELNGELHSYIHMLSGNALLPELIRSVTQLPVVGSTFRRYSPEQMRRSMSQHRELVEALGAADGQWAEAVMRTHVLSARHAALSSALAADDDLAGSVRAAGYGSS